MKKGGVREVNSFISVNSPTKVVSSNKLTNRVRTFGVGERQKIKESDDEVEARNNTKINRSNSVLRTRTSGQVSKIRINNDPVKVPQVQKSNPIPKSTPKTKPEISIKPIKSVKKEPPSKGKSIVDEKRGTSLGKFTLEDVYKRRLSRDIDKKASSSSRSSSGVSTSLILEKEEKETKHTFTAPDHEIEYEDDFEDYESDFESYSGSNDSASQHESENSDHENQKINEEEKKMDSGSYDLYRSRKQMNQLEVIREALNKENKAVQQLNDSLIVNPTTESSETESLNFLFEFNTKSLQNFTSARRRQRNSLISNQIKTRGEKLLSMVTLDIMQYNLYERAPITYEVFMRCYAKNNTLQAYVQTNEDNLSSEIQTEEIKSLSKWTQYPIQITKDILIQGTNLKEILLGVGDETSIFSYTLEYNHQKLNDFLKSAGEEMISLLEEEMSICYNVTEKFETSTKISDSVSCLKCNSVSFLKDRSITSVIFNPHSQSRLMTLHGYTNTLEENDRCSYVCVWNVHQPITPKVVLRSYGIVNCCCFVGDDSSFIVAGHDDGSLCVWDLRESSMYYNKIHHINNEIKVRSPSYNTAQVLREFNHSSRIINIESLSNDGVRNSNDFKTEIICSMEEESYLIVWNLSRNFTKATDIASAPWSRIKFFASQVIDIVKFIPKNIFQSTTFKIISESKIFIGTNTGLTLKCSSYDKKCKVYGKSLPDSKDRSKITCLEICPYDLDRFAVGYNNGNIHLYNYKYIEPILNIEQHNVSSVGIKSLQWLWNKQNYILALNLNSALFIYRFLSESYSLVHEIKMNDIYSIAVSPFHNLDKNTPYLALTSSKGYIEIHKFNSLVFDFEEN